MAQHINQDFVFTGETRLFWDVDQSEIVPVFLDKTEVTLIEWGTAEDGRDEITLRGFLKPAAELFDLREQQDFNLRILQGPYGDPRQFVSDYEILRAENCRVKYQMIEEPVVVHPAEEVMALILVITCDMRVLM